MEFDEFCLPDDVLAALDGLGAASGQGQAPGSGPAAPQPSSGVGSAADPGASFRLLPPGPLMPPGAGLPRAHGPRLNSAQCPEPAVTAQGVHGPCPTTMQQLQAGSSSVSCEEHHAALGEVQLLRARLEQAGQQAQMDRHRTAQLQAELQQARAEKTPSTRRRCRSSHQISASERTRFSGCSSRGATCRHSLRTSRLLCSKACRTRSRVCLGQRR